MAEGDEWNEFDTQQLLENGMISADCGILQAAASSRWSFILSRLCRPTTSGHTSTPYYAVSRLIELRCIDSAPTPSTIIILSPPTKLLVASGTIEEPDQR